MTGPDSHPRPSVSTAPAEGASASGPTAPPPQRPPRLPGHLGPARTSTVLLAVAFVAIGLLYLFVRPETPDTAGTTTDPASTSDGSAPARQAPDTSAPEQTPSGTPTETAETLPLESSPSDGTTPEETPTDDPTEPTTGCSTVRSSSGRVIGHPPGPRRRRPRPPPPAVAAARSSPAG